MERVVSPRRCWLSEPDSVGGFSSKASSRSSDEEEEPSNKGPPTRRSRNTQRSPRPRAIAGDEEEEKCRYDVPRAGGAKGPNKYDHVKGRRPNIKDCEKKRQVVCAVGSCFRSFLPRVFFGT